MANLVNVGAHIIPRGFTYIEEVKDLVMRRNGLSRLSTLSKKPQELVFLERSLV